MNKRVLVKILIDGGTWFTLSFVAFYLRLEGQIASKLWDIFLLSAALLPIKLLLISSFKLQYTSWRFSTVNDFIPILSAISIYTILYISATFYMSELVYVPFTVPFIEAILTIVAFILIRLASRFVLRERHSNRNSKVYKDEARRILILGAGESGTMIAKEMVRHPQMGMVPVAFLDDAAVKQNQRIQGLPVLGPMSIMSKAVREHAIDEVLIAMSSEAGDVIRRLVEEATRANVNYKTVPGLYDLISGKVAISQIRNVQVEDLLRRNPIKLNTAKIERYIKGKRVLVSGAGGSIGSEIIRQIARFSPAKIILVGRGESSIFEAMHEFNDKYPNLNFDVRICDVRDISTLELVFRDTRPEVVFHAAAHKHVTLMEKNPAQAIFNNVGGTKNMATLALEYDVKYFVNLSTDKAVNPTSIMGASKRIAENVILQAAIKAKNDQVFVSVRFGNVLGSRGSVVPIFKSQIDKGGPLTITDPDMIRYFMTIPEASQLVLQAAALNMNGAVFVLDMGDPVKIVDMARDLIRLSGFEPDKDIKIVFTGKKEGEKLFEELLTSEEGTEMTQHDKIMVSRINKLDEDFEVKLDMLFDAANSGDEEGIKSMVYSIVPTYSGIKVGKAKSGIF